MGFVNHIRAIALREMTVFRRRPIFLLGSIGVMTFCAAFYLTFFNKGLPDDISIGVVDLDNSSMSRSFMQQLSSTQLGMTVKYSSVHEASLDLQAGKIGAYCVIPEGMYADVSAQRRPTFTFYISGLYYVYGSLAYKSVLQMINLVNGAVQRKVLYAKGMSKTQAMGMIRPFNVDNHQIGNPYTNYGYYLANVMIPGMLGMIVTVLTIFAFGCELKYGTSKHLLDTAEGSMMDVICGKAAFYIPFFSSLGLILIILMYDFLDFPIQGSIGNMFIGIILLVMASFSLGLFIVSMLPVTRLAMSIGSLVCVMGISLSGFSLPVDTMSPWMQGMASAIPLRHYYLFYVQEVFFGSGFAGWWQQAVWLMVFNLLPFIGLQRLKNAFYYRNYAQY